MSKAIRNPGSESELNRGHYFGVPVRLKGHAGTMRGLQRINRCARATHARRECVSRELLASRDRVCDAQERLTVPLERLHEQRRMLRQTMNRSADCRASLVNPRAE